MITANNCLTAKPTKKASPYGGSTQIRRMARDPLALCMPFVFMSHAGKFWVAANHMLAQMLVSYMSVGRPSVVSGILHTYYFEYKPDVETAPRPGWTLLA